MIRMHHQNLKETSIEWWLDRLCCMEQSVGQLKLTCQKDESDGNEDIEVDEWSYEEREN